MKKGTFEEGEREEVEKEEGSNGAENMEVEIVGTKLIDKDGFQIVKKRSEVLKMKHGDTTREKGKKKFAPKTE